MNKFSKFSLYCFVSIIGLALIGLIFWLLAENHVLRDLYDWAFSLWLGCALPVIIWIIGTVSYNRLVSIKQKVEQQNCEINVQLQRRMDLVYNLMNTVKGYSLHESGTFENVTRTRTALNNALNLEQNGQQSLNSGQDFVNHAIRGYIYMQLVKHIPNYGLIASLCIYNLP